MADSCAVVVEEQPTAWYIWSILSLDNLSLLATNYPSMSCYKRVRLAETPTDQAESLISTSSCKQSHVNINNVDDGSLDVYRLLSCRGPEDKRQDVVAARQAYCLLTY